MSGLADLLHTALSGVFLPITASLVVVFLCRRRIREVWTERDVAGPVDEFERYCGVLGEMSEVR